MNEVSKIVSNIRQTVIGNILHEWLKYSPAAYYVFLALYCIMIAIIGRDRIPPIAVLPYVYSFVGPAILLTVVLLVRFVASILYRDWRFRSTYGASLVTILIAILMAYLPNTSGLYDSVINTFSFQWMDFILITISLWEVAFRVFYSMYRSEREEQVLLNWFERIDDVAIKGILIQSTLMAFPGLLLANLVKLLDLRDVWVGLCFLSLGYISIALIRFFMVDSEIGFTSLRDTILRKLLERDLRIYAKEFDIHPEVTSTEDEKDGESMN